MESPPKLDKFPLKTYDKIRYGDTDRQGHVNNAVFSTYLESGRVEVFYRPEEPLTDTNCSFVIANLTLNFLSEITWPGRVDVGTGVSAVGRSSVTLEQTLFQGKTCTATATSVIVQINDDTRRSHPLSEAAVAYLEKMKFPS